MTPTLSISADGAFEVTVRRNAAVPEVLWSKVTTEWGDGTASSTLRVPADRFLSNIEWLPEYCRRFNTGVEWSDGARVLVGRAVEERGALQATLDNGITAVPEAEVASRLSQGRFKRDLHPFQLRDLGKLLALRNGANFSVPGAGKTTVTYALYEAERQAQKVDRLVVVAPLSAFEAWTDEAEVCFHTVPAIHRLTTVGLIPASAEVLLVNYQRLHRAYRKLVEWAQGGRCHVVLDEAHRMKKGWSGQWGRASLNLAYFAARRDVLTGTPAPQALKDLDAILDFAWPTQARRILSASVFQRSPPQGLASQTGARIRPLFVRTTKSDLGLRRPEISVVEHQLQGLQSEIYTALRNQYAGQLALARSDRNRLARMGQVTMYLLEAATNPGLLPVGGPFDPRANAPRFPLLEVPKEGDLAQLIERYHKHEVPPKFATLASMVRANAEQGRKTLVWTNFIKNIETLEVMLAGMKPAIIHGGVPWEGSASRRQRTREQELHRFRTEDACSVLLANPAATSEGISLHKTCHDAIYLDRTFNAGHYLQSIDRIHRLGMDPNEETRITILATLGTVDVTVDNRVEAKAMSLGAILSDDDIRTMALPDDVDYKEAIAEEDLPALFAHLRGEDAELRPAPRP